MKKVTENLDKKSKSSTAKSVRISSKTSSTTKKSSTTSLLKECKAKKVSKKEQCKSSTPIEVKSSTSVATETTASIKRLSFTQIDRYNRCPYRYKLTYVNHEEEPLPWIVIKGILAHSAIADLLRLKAGITPEWKDIREEFYAIKSRQNEDITPTMIAEIGSTVGLFMSDVLPMNYPKFVEYPVEVYETIDSTIIEWLGYIDCIEDDDTIIDHKITGKRHSERSPWQMNIYQRAYPKAKNFIYQEITPSGVNFIQIPLQKVLNVKEEIDHRVIELLSENYPKIKGRQCDYCYFKKSCFSDES